ncbi:hypothetical protein QUF80_20905 [Desulfococcaceae bacterium HSG8]|nr:hypothetical protein [Desulfococcaceae bacterium HSG8]
MTNKINKLFMKSSVFIFWVIISLIILTAKAEADTEKLGKIDAPWKTEAELQKRVADSLWRLEKAIRRDGFPSAICALNIWRCNATDAGIFDRGQYDEFKRQIYQKSIAETLAWFEVCIEEGWTRDADFWHRVYYVRANEIGKFDQTKYDKMMVKIKKIKKRKKK